MSTVMEPSPRLKLDEYSREQLRSVREEYGSLSQFLKGTKNRKSLRAGAIYAASRTDTDTNTEPAKHTKPRK